MKARDLIRSGLSPEEAHERAQLAFGDEAWIRRECADVQREVSHRTGSQDRWDAWERDVRLSLRSLRRDPRFTALLVLTLGLGIGATSTVFSMLDALLAAPLAFPQHERLGLLFERRRSQGLERDHFSLHGYRDLRDAAQSFDLTAHFTNRGTTLTGDGAAERVGVLWTSSSLMALLGAVPEHGRLLAAEDDRPGAPLTAVLGYDLWQRRYGGDPRVVGTSITLNDEPIPVSGVLSAEFPSEALRLWAGNVDIFVNGAGTAPSGAQISPDLGVHTILARRKGDVSWERAWREMNGLARGLSEAWGYPLELELVPLSEEVSGSARPALFAMFGAAAILLIITCANAATILLSKAPDREREMALRSALGAGRERLLRRAALEYALTAFLGAALAIAVVVGAQAALKDLAPELGWIADRSSIGGWSTIPWLRAVDIDARVLVFTAAVAVLTSFLFGLAPAVRVLHADPNALLRGGRAAPYPLLGSRTRLTLRDALTVVQIALAFVLLVGGSLLVQSFLAARSTDLGFSPRNVLSLYVNPSGNAYRSRAAAVAFYEEAFTELERIPGVVSVGAVDGLPLTGGVGWGRVASGPVDEQKNVAPGQRGTVSLMRHVTPGYFETMGIQLVSGRLFDAGDRDDAPRVLVVDEAFAQRMWPDDNAVGKRVYAVDLGRCRQGCLRGEVVGIVESVRYEPAEAEQRMTFYDVLPQAGDGGHGLYAVVKTTSDPGLLTVAARRAVQGVDPDQPVIDVRTMEERLSDTLVVRRLSALALQTFALLALALALVGLYGTISYGVSRELHSMAIRIALGAHARDVTGLVLRRTLLLVATGLLLGLLSAVAVMRFPASVLFDVSPTDLPTLVILCVVFLVLSAFAAVVPAKRAAHADPLEHLRAT